MTVQAATRIFPVLYESSSLSERFFEVSCRLGRRAFFWRSFEAHSPSMPLHGLRHDHVDVVTPLAALPSLLVSLAMGKPVNPACATETT